MSGLHSVNFLLVATTVAYVLCFISGFFVIVPLKLLTDQARESNFGDDEANMSSRAGCLLFACVDSDSATEPLKLTGTDMILCNFTTYLNLVPMVAGIALAVYYGFAIRRDLNAATVHGVKQHGAREMWIWPWLLVDSVISVFVFINAVIITAGFAVFCSKMDLAMDSINTYSNCYAYLDDKWGDSVHFHFSTAMVMYSSWLVVVLWVVVWLLSFTRLVRNSKISTNTDDNTYVSEEQPSD